MATFPTFFLAKMASHVLCVMCSCHFALHNPDTNVISWRSIFIFVELFVFMLDSDLNSYFVPVTLVMRPAESVYIIYRTHQLLYSPSISPFSLWSAGPIRAHIVNVTPRLTTLHLLVHNWNRVLIESNAYLWIEYNIFVNHISWHLTRSRM